MFLACHTTERMKRLAEPYQLVSLWMRVFSESRLMLNSGFGKQPCARASRDSTMEVLLTAPEVGAKVVTMTIDFSAALSSLSAFMILLDQHLYGGLILKPLAKTVLLGIRAWRSRAPSCQVAHPRQWSCHHPSGG